MSGLQQVLVVSIQTQVSQPPMGHWVRSEIPQTPVSRVFKLFSFFSSKVANFLWMLWGFLELQGIHEKLASLQL